MNMTAFLALNICKNVARTNLQTMLRRVDKEWGDYMQESTSLDNLHVILLL